jgi:hypothetical protein
MSARLKDLAVSLRDLALTKREVSYVPEVPRRVQYWLRGIARTDARRILAFTRYARALPKSSRAAVQRAYTAHLVNLSEPIRTKTSDLESLEQYVATRFGKGLRKRYFVTLPSSKNSVVGSTGSKGGYDQWILTLCVSKVGESVLNGRMFDHARGRARWAVKLRSCLTGDRPAYAASIYNRLFSLIKSPKWETMRDYPDFLQCLGTLVSLEEFESRSAPGGGGFDHTATALAEQGSKVRVITVPPGSVFTAGDRVRRRVFPVLRKQDVRLESFETAVAGGRLDELTLSPGEGWLSADLTKATDGFSHDAIQAVIRGLARAGLAPYMCKLAAESLGVGASVHYVRYRLGDLTEDGRKLVEAQSWVDIKDRAYARVPMRRGCLMGTPLSFTVLSLINGWACEPLGRKTHITGDDVVSACTPPKIGHYRSRVESVGSGLHERKSFFGTRGFTFCESFALAAGGNVGVAPTFYNPYPLKQYMRDGNGVMDKGNYYAPQWKKLRRVARVLSKPVRAKARRLLRPPELPVSLGGLGHPGKGMRSIPGVVRAQLYGLLFEGHDPSKYCTRVDIFFAPSDPRRFENVRAEVAGRARVGKPAFEHEQPPHGHSFVPNRKIGKWISTRAHKGYFATGGRYRPCKPMTMKPGKLKLPTPSVRQFSKFTPLASVERWWAEKLDREGRFVPVRLALEILDACYGTNIPSTGR